jgi:hypothetical protein
VDEPHAVLDRIALPDLKRDGVCKSGELWTRTLELPGEMAPLWLVGWQKEEDLIKEAVVPD